MSAVVNVAAPGSPRTAQSERLRVCSLGHGIVRREWAKCLWIARGSVSEVHEISTSLGVGRNLAAADEPEPPLICAARCLKNFDDGHGRVLAAYLIGHILAIVLALLWGTESTRPCRTFMNLSGKLSERRFDYRLSIGRCLGFSRRPGALRVFLYRCHSSGTAVMCSRSAPLARRWARNAPGPGISDGRPRPPVGEQSADRRSCSSPVSWAASATRKVRAFAPKCVIVRIRAGFKKSEQDDRWSFCLTAGTLCPANQERPCNDDRAGTTHRP